MSFQTDPDDPFYLQRFLDAQTRAYGPVLAAISQRTPVSFRLWSIFPRLRPALPGVSHFFRLTSPEAARAFEAHALLGPRLKDVAEAVVTLDHREIKEVFNADALRKIRASMTLFAGLSGKADSVYAQVLAKHFFGEGDPETMILLARANAPSA
ncbi:DUF1810 family protein [Asticcacaulis solisilvae]|uniref:DUF1810 family protein n=1 Tax=Asticcacaulis solisilvae TaxID=1217274 RepID=UPI003FD753EA